MTAVPDLPIPPDLALDAEPLTDADLDRYFLVLDEMTDLGDDEAAVTLERDAADDAAAGIDPLPADRAARFVIDDDGKAEWALRRLAAAETEVTRLGEQAEDWSRRIGEWFDQAVKRPRRTAAFMEDRLAAYARQCRADGRGATLNLPSGTIKTTERKPAPDVVDDEVVVAYIEARTATPPPDASDEACERYRGWLDAVESVTDAETPLVRTTRKVFARPFASLVRVETRPTSATVTTVTLDCDHEFTETVEDGAGRAPRLGETLECPVCPSDPIEGPRAAAVVAVGVEPVLEQIVVGPDGEQVPGTTVKPGAVTVSVKAR